MSRQLDASRVRAGDALWAAVVPWLLGLLLTVLALAVASEIGRHAGGAVHVPGTGLATYDAHWYSLIAERGYAHLPAEALRFFPLFPLSVRYLDAALPGGAAAAGLVLAGSCALGYLVLLWRLVATDLRSSGNDAATRTVWLVALAPAGFVLSIGYADGLAGLLAVGTFLLLRRRSFGPAVATGLLAGLCRPTGLLLSVPALIEATRGLGGVPMRHRPVRLAAVAAPVAGAAAYLGWVAHVFGDPLLPFRVQSRSDLRGRPVALPLGPLKHSFLALVHGREPTVAAHLPGTLIVLALLVVAARRLPLSYLAYAAAVLATTFTAYTLGSFERYSAAAFPLFVALALATRRPTIYGGVLAVSAALMFGYAVLAFLQLYTP